ncbi:hypothetical protein PHLGIDRAFT_32626 [Phlebiopsis gigantea 11061_1 CR5-6]|uniref:Uncharacterized protein n=1 Tax=Phlebiopsis gigantea (strain 11061_1 CR5-6) TaxID=745531 RepID=A0A0C3SFU3_PHLG1|nr:hypothetical protein PHLGIDRAFT_32626 [Phlebiopsis gigantea 11061_1 CR5-6]
MDTPKVLADAFTHHLDGFMNTLSKIVQGGTNFGNFPLDLSDNVLDAAFEKLALATSYIRTIKNSHKGVCSLPGELLDKIFSFTAYHLDDFMPFSTRLQWMDLRWHPSILSGVCRYWRAVTLSYPSMWSTIYLGDTNGYAGLDFAQMCLRRSYGSLLRVYIDCFQPIPPETYFWTSETLASQSVRFKSFHFRAPMVDERLLVVLAECPAPQLQNLSLQLTSRALPPQVPTLFAGFLPELKRLTTSFCSIWPHHLTTLTHICLDDPPMALQAAQIVELLACNLQVEVLTLGSTSTRPMSLEEEVLEPAAPISLPQLRDIYIHGHCSTSFCARLLNAIRPAPTAAIQIECKEQRRPTTSHTLVTALARLPFVGNLSAMKLATHLTPGVLTTPALSIQGTGISSLDLRYSADIHEMASNQYMAALLSLLSASGTCELWIERDLVITREPLWQRIFFSLPLVTRLVLGPWDRYPILGNAPDTSNLTALCVIDETLGRALPCPLLEELVVIGQLKPALDRWLTPELKDFLLSRKDRGFPIRKLTIVEEVKKRKFGGDKILAGDLEALKEMVAEVIHLTEIPKLHIRNLDEYLRQRREH